MLRSAPPKVRKLTLLLASDSITPDMIGFSRLLASFDSSSRNFMFTGPVGGWPDELSDKPLVILLKLTTVVIKVHREANMYTVQIVSGLLTGTVGALNSPAMKVSVF